MNPYKILDIPENSSLDDVKKAYKTLAKKYHPDVNKEPNAAEKFNEITEAYNKILNPPQEQPFEYDTEFNDIFSSIFGSNFNSRRNVFITRRVAIEISFEEAHSGTDKAIYVDNGIQNIKIPEGTLDKSQLVYNTENTRLVIDIHVKPTDNMIAHGKDIIRSVKLSATEFSSLNNIEIENHIGKKFNIGLKSGTDTHSLLKIPKAGLYDGRTKSYGDLLIKLVIFKD